MKRSEAQAEIEDLLDQLVGESSPDMLVDMAMDEAMSRCQVKHSRRPHARKLLVAFFEALSGRPFPSGFPVRSGEE